MGLQLFGRLLLLLLCLLLECTTQQPDFRLLRATGVDDETLHWLIDQQLDLWSVRPIVDNDDNNKWTIEFLFPKSSDIRETLTSRLSVSVLDDSIATTVANEREVLRTRHLYDNNNNNTIDEFFNAFREYDEFLQFYSRLSNTYAPFVRQTKVGVTEEGREIIGFIVTAPSEDDDYDNNAIVKEVVHLQAMQHAREWLAPTTLLYVVVNLLDRYDTDPDARLLLDNLVFSVVPIVNADGYIYTWSKDRLWRKNRRLNSDGTYGVDLNRNWGPASTWCTSGSSTSPYSEVYCGTAPFSESETRTLAAYLETLQHTAGGGAVRAGIDFHTYGPLLLWPWQYTYDRLPEEYYKIYQMLGKSIEKSINGVHQMNYVSEQGSDLYPHSGGFIDYNWIENEFYAFTLEGRGPSFIVPAEEIVPAGEEAYAGVVTLSKFVLNNAVVHKKR